jgi:hypothetical protein
LAAPMTGLRSHLEIAHAKNPLSADRA